MKKILTFCASLVFLLGVLGGAKAALVTTTIKPSLGAITSKKIFNNEFNERALGLADVTPFSFLFEDIFPFTIPVTTTVVTSSATSFQVSGKNIKDFRGAIFSGVFGSISPTPTNLTGGVVGCVLVGVPVIGCTISFPNLTLASGAHFIQLLGEANGLGSIPLPPGGPTGDPNIIGDYTGTIAPIPLPPAAVLFLSALAGLAGFSRIRRRKKAVAT